MQSYLKKISMHLYMDKLQETVENLTLENRQKVLKFIHSQGIKLHEHADGTRINLDNLNTEQQRKLKLLVNFLHEFSSDNNYLIE